MAAALKPLCVVLLCGLVACQPKLDLGDWTCSPDGGASVIPPGTDPVTVGWQTGFENRFCDYTDLAGFCYDPGSFTLVTSPPPHSGKFAAAFTVDSASTSNTQSRCVRQGALPDAAYYEAWYYLPVAATNKGNWNLFHFAGGSDLSHLGGFFDVSLVSTNGALQLALYGVGHARLDNPVNTVPVPIGSWFHVQLYLKRAAGTAGEARLYQDDQQLCDATNVATDNSALGQWYVGNLVDTGTLTPPDSTVYVDDVSISSTL